MSQRKIILYANVESDVNFGVTKQVANILKSNGWQIVLCPAIFDETTTVPPPSGYIYSYIDDELHNAEMIVTLGGDGTILKAARAAADLSVPILGINLGGKGFMAELEVDDIHQLDAAINSEYNIENRLMIDVHLLRDGEVIWHDYALNDIVIKGDNKVIDMTIFGDNQKITHFTGDGVVIATPTGSTAYSMSAGGPIVDPAAKNIIITPICAHVLEARSFVLLSGRIVTVDIGYKKANPAYISVDGGKHTNIQSGDVVRVLKSERNTQLVRLSDKSFYRKVSEKLGER
ncbi:MAG: NAD(+)/NADH kinase [Oscillospiraceae bacterium]|nr:NAD(+)/NADH kinase [Oscillospiraceae bacterium]